MNLKNKYKKLNPESRLYNFKHPIIALTGGIATGKSTASNYLKTKNHPLICADKLIKDIYKNEETINFFSKNLPDFITKNVINFKKLKETAFEKSEVLSILENYLYPKLKDVFNKEVNEFENLNYIIYDIPLLFEKQLHQYVDVSICVYAKMPVQIERIIKRDNIDSSLAQKIINAQMNIDTKKSLADFVIQNDKDIDHLVQNINKIEDQLFT